MIENISLITLVFAVVTAALFLCNYSAFRCAPRTDPNLDHELPAVSVLIPARDEAANIRASLTSVLANQAVELEVIVLDDHSRDATAEIVAEIAAADPRVRLFPGKPLPSGWCGKQFACHQLVQHARHAVLVFLDADVRLADDGIRRCLLQQRKSATQLVSGFPRQRVGTLGEALLIPQMYIVLLTFLPFLLMRKTKMPAASAGCGQLFMTTRDDYLRSGGHAAIRSSMHDGVSLPRAYRRNGMSTDVFDASDMAVCRMYHGFGETWRGLIKNAHEGIANVRLIVPFSCLLLMGYAVPVALAIYALLSPASPNVLWHSLLAAAVCYLPRSIVAWRFDGSWLGAVLSPLSISLFVALQWIAFGRHLFGARSVWRDRAYAPTTG